MKTLATLVMFFVLPAGPAHAASFDCFESDPCRWVTYEHAFSVAGEEFTPEDSGLWFEYMRVPDPFDLWTIPPFDFSTGTPEVLLIEIEGTITMSGRIHDLAGATEVNLFAIASTLVLDTGGGPNVIGDVAKSCTAAPCDFFSTGPFGDSTYVLPLPDGTGWTMPWWSDSSFPSIVLPIPYWSPDTFFRLRDENGNLMAAPITFRTELTGIARATYLYEPAAVPEPTTVVLVASGAAVLIRRRYRRTNGGSARTNRI